MPFLLQIKQANRFSFTNLPDHFQAKQYGLSMRSGLRCAFFQIDEPLEKSSLLEFRREIKEKGEEIIMVSKLLDKKKPSLFVFDMDSTLIREEVIDEMARLNGVYEEVSAITKEAMEGGLNFEASLRKRVQLLEGMSEDELHSVYSALNPMSGMTELFSFLRDAGSKIVVLSGGFIPILKLFQKKYGITDFKANQLEVDQSILTGRLIGEIITPEAKAEYVSHYQELYKIELEQLVVAGDGANDIQMIQLGGIGLGFHPKEALKREVLNWIQDLPLTALIFLFGPGS